MENKQTRAFIYAFLSTVFANTMTHELINDIKNNEELLLMIGDNAKEYLQKNEDSLLQEELSTDFSSIFLMYNQPIESAVLDNKNDVLVGLQNPVMQFYFQSGYEINMTLTHIQTPDHISIEFSFMQNLILKDDIKKQIDFLNKHLLEWVPQFLLACKDMAHTPFYKDLFDFCTEFLVSDYHLLVEKYKE